MIKRKFKTAVQILAKIFAIGIFLIVFVLSIQAAFIDLSEYEQTTGVVTNSGTFISNGKSNFYLKLNGLSALFTSYNVTRSYNSLTELINVGDTVTIYYPAVSYSEIEVVQIEKGNIVILNKSSFENKWRIVAIITFLAIIWILFEKRIKRSISLKLRRSRTI